ncbi:lipase family protein [Hufsiella ginkgonis]|uniref:Fungal lipase-type domain-containing protein n=1 Tax=Hufsiella ginkgonis TaxID=2695274 RepID=A0A7K1Y1D4_9SPHI|nr:lipase family protein [Hufsiella ginkgonis]MXV17041.1 hypothetical protein [Hufsiella ginkgonis]
MTEYQQTFLLSMLSNQAPELVNQPFPENLDLIQQDAEQLMESQFLASIPERLTAMGGFATLEWGPAIFIDPSDIQEDTKTKTYNATATNTMAVFSTGSTGVYTIAIAGTKATSIFDEKTEDAKVGVLVDWAYGVPVEQPVLKPRISTGTNDGLGVLLSLPDPKTGVNLATYLSTLASGTVITITGHSLGGGLAPALSLALFGAASNISPSLLKQGLLPQVYATAGPDIGNKDYVTYLSGTFKATTPPPANKYEQYNCKIWNSLDVVPHAWSPAFLSQIKSIYKSYGMDTPGYVGGVIDAVSADIKAHNYDPLPYNPYYSLDDALNGQFPGKFQPLDSFPSDSFINYNCNNNCNANVDVCNFVTEMLFQHIDAYFNELQIPFQAPANKMDACAITQKLDPL